MRHLVLILMVLGFLAGCQVEDKLYVTFVNPTDLDRPAEGIELRADAVPGNRAEGDTLLPVLVDRKGNYVTCQVEDTDGDGEWDQLFTVLSFGPAEEKQMEIRFIGAGEYPAFEARTNIRLADKKNNYTEVERGVRQNHSVNTVTAEYWQMEGIGFENEYVGFRNYFDQRNGMDIFGKVVRRMVLDSVGYRDQPDYHAFNPDWGMDVLKVGASLGSGGIAIRYNDTLFRVGDNGLGTYEETVEGPLRSLFRLDYIDWSMDGTLINVLHRVSIQAGTRYFTGKVIYEGIGEDLDVIAGIVNMKSDKLMETASAGYRIFYTHAPQSEDGSMLGMAVMIPEVFYGGNFMTADQGEGIIETYCIAMGTTPGHPVEYRFYSLWEKEDPKWKDPAEIKAYLEEEAVRASEPVLVRFD